MMVLNETVCEVGNVLYSVFPGIYEAVETTCPDKSPSTCNPHHPNTILTDPHKTSNHKDNTAREILIRDATGGSASGCSGGGGVGTYFGENNMQSLKAALWKLILVLCS
jgi:hypothetical protein